MTIVELRNSVDFKEINDEFKLAGSSPTNLVEQSGIVSALRPSFLRRQESRYLIYEEIGRRLSGHDEKYHTEFKAI
jgi:hypothetical protein